MTHRQNSRMTPRFPAARLICVTACASALQAFAHDRAAGCALRHRMLLIAADSHDQYDTRRLCLQQTRSSSRYLDDDLRDLETVPREKQTLVAFFRLYFRCFDVIDSMRVIKDQD
jgi:hypothetical protein